MDFGEDEMEMNFDYRAQRPVVVSSAYGDVNGDGVTDHVYLTAVKPAQQDSPFWQQITLMIQCGKTKRLFKISLDPNGNAGYNPVVFLGDFTNDHVQDILVRIDSGGSGAFTYNYVYSFVHNHARKLFDYNRFNEDSKYRVQYMNGYKVKVTAFNTSQSYMIDISGRGSDYLSQLYHPNGQLKKPVEGGVDVVSGFYPVDMDWDGVYELQLFQRITGLYQADSFGYVVSILRWDGHRFAIWQQWVAIFGQEIHGK